MAKKFLLLEFNREIKVYDAATSISELARESCINFLYGFTANFMTPFIAARKDLGVFVAFISFYFVISYILNRNRYETKLGKYIVMPIPAALGAFTSYKVAYLIVDWLK